MYNYSRENKQTEKKHGLRKALTALLIILLLALGVTIVLGYDIISEILADPRVHIIKPGNEDNTAVAADGTALAYNRNIVNVLFVGVDSDGEREKLNMGYRSDTLILAAIDVAAKKATMISIPRDTRMEIRSLDASGKVKGNEFNRANAAFSYGGRTMEQRYDNTVYCIERFLSSDGVKIPIDYYAGVDMEGFAPIVDAIGGIDIVLDMDFPAFGKKDEKVHFNGTDALTFVRERHEGGIGDIGRAKHQQQALFAIAARVKEMGPVSAVPALYSQVSKYMHTSLSLENMAALAVTLRDMDMEDIEFKVVPGAPKTIKGTSYYIADIEELKKMLLEVYYVKK